MANPSADFPTNLHTPTDVSALASQKLGQSSPKHSEVEGKQEAEIVATQTKIGKTTGSAQTPTDGKILTGATTAGTSEWNTVANAIGKEFPSMPLGYAIGKNADTGVIEPISLAAGAGETNTGANIGNAGTGVYATKSGVQLQFKNISSPNSTVSITDNTNDHNIELEVNESNIHLGDITGTLAVNKGGTGQTSKTAAFDALSPMDTIGDTVYGGALGTGTKLAGNTTNTRKFLRQVGSGGVATAPAWDTLQAGDIPSITASKVSDFDSQVNTHKLNQLTAPDSAVDMNSKKITSLADGTLATDAVNKGQLDALLAANDAMVFKGSIDASGNPNYPAADAGHTYRISVAGKIGGASGVNVEVNDTITCITDSTAEGTQAAVGANWTIVQANIDGAVVGPASSTSGNFASFNGTGGKLIQDSGSKAADFSPAAGSASITTVGTIGTGTWNGTAIDATHGGTGATTTTKGDVLVGGTNAWAKLGVGSDNYVLTADAAQTNGVKWALPNQESFAISAVAGDTITANKGVFFRPTDGKIMPSPFIKHRDAYYYDVQDDINVSYVAPAVYLDNNVYVRCASSTTKRIQAFKHNLDGTTTKGTVVGQAVTIYTGRSTKAVRVAPYTVLMVSATASDTTGYLKGTLAYINPSTLAVTLGTEQTLVQQLGNYEFSITFVDGKVLLVYYNGTDINFYTIEIDVLNDRMACSPVLATVAGVNPTNMFMVEALSDNHFAVAYSVPGNRLTVGELRDGRIKIIYSGQPLSTANTYSLGVGALNFKGAEVCGIFCGHDTGTTKLAVRAFRVTENTVVYGTEDQSLASTRVAGNAKRYMSLGYGCGVIVEESAVSQSVALTYVCVNPIDLAIAKLTRVTTAFGNEPSTGTLVRTGDDTYAVIIEGSSSYGYHQNLQVPQLVGIALTGGAAGATCSVAVKGKVTSLSGLTIGRMQYALSDGTVTGAACGWQLGYSYSATSLYLEAFQPDTEAYRFMKVSKNVRPGQKLPPYVDVTSTNYPATGEQTLKSFLMPRSQMWDNGDEIEITACGTFAANANSKTVRVYFGTTAIKTSAVSTNGGSWTVKARVMRTGASSQTYYTQAWSTDDNLSTTGTTAIDLSSDPLIKVTGDCTAASDMACTVLRVRPYPILPYA